MARAQRPGRGLCAGRIVGRFDEVVILGRHDCHFSLPDDVLAESIETGVSTTNSTLVIVDIACRGVELVGKFLSLRARRRGLGGRRRPECVQPNKGYAPGTSSDDSTTPSLEMPFYLFPLLFSSSLASK